MARTVASRGKRLAVSRTKFGKAQAVGLFHSCERFQDPHQLVRSAAGGNDLGAQPVAGRQHLAGAEGGFA